LLYTVYTDLPLPLALEIRESDGNSPYSDDTAVWVIAEDIEEAQRELQRLSDAMVKFTRDNGFALSGAKTQVMIGGAKAKDISNITIHVNNFKPSILVSCLPVTTTVKKLPNK
jgi:predicted DNA-binding helix-hairpin-helix protein